MRRGFISSPSEASSTYPPVAGEHHAPGGPYNRAGMPGYSQTPLARKLGIKPGTRLALDLAPTGWSVPELPDDVIAVDAPAPADILVAFFREEAELPVRLPDLAQRIFPAGSLWVAWPRRAGGHRSYITENALRDHALPLGIVDIKVAAIDADWSGLKFMWRREKRQPPQ
jgi:hypothetical protein